MTLSVIGFHFAAALSLFLLINWIGRHSTGRGYRQLTLFARVDEAPAFNFLYRAASPVVFIVIVGAALYTLGLDSFADHIYLIVVYYVGFRVLFNLFLNRTRLLNWNYQAGLGIVTIGASYLVYVKIISVRENVLPDFDSISNELWLLIMLFLFQAANNIRISQDGTKKRKRRYLRHRVTLFSRRYGDLIREAVAQPILEPLVYAIMIQEDFNRPPVLRMAERVLSRIGAASTLGIMQVKSDQAITDRESVELAVAKLNSDFRAALHEEDERLKKRLAERRVDEDDDLADIISWWTVQNAIRRTVGEYNRHDEYVDDVMSVFRLVLDEFYTDMKTNVERSLGTEGG